ncbi:MAG: Cytochrome bd-I ubiquinol oxidase subunit 2 [Chlamydiae bacterium]|nr:Cytochrome bd-I ubiquinol oxidase subunit 2 [Chlamydiota bacterium]
MNLEIAFYLVIVTCLICYAMLDGFDLGVGLLHPFAKSDEERRIFLNAIGPIWDGNEVWLVVVGGALFAGFPGVFASIFSSFYTFTMILLMGLIFRAVSIEFRSKRESPRWRSTWDWVFALGSLVISFGIGLILGNLITGVPLNEDFNYIGTFTTFLNPYAVLVAFMAIALFAMHGSIFLVMKTQGELHDRMRRYVPRCIALFIILYIVVTIATHYDKPYMIAPMLKYPALFLVPLVSLTTIISVPFLMKHQKDGWAFLSSCLSIALLLSLVTIGTYPYMLRSTVNPETNSLLIFNSSSSQLTLKILLIIVAIGIPLVLAYGFYAYRVFRGKVELEDTSY